ncbi:hypothetical protein FRC06_010763, partial [Ceratobasidium sp. 370]
SLRALARSFGGVFGSHLGTSHTSPDLVLDIDKLMKSLDTENVYRLCPGRTFHDKDEPVPDAESVGLQGLLDGKSPALKEYNISFKATQEAHQWPTVSKMVPHTSLPRHPSNSMAPVILGESPSSTQQDSPQNEGSSFDHEVDSEDSSDEQELGVEDESEEDFETQQAVADIDLIEAGPADEFFSRTVNSPRRQW